MSNKFILCNTCSWYFLHIVLCFVFQTTSLHVVLFWSSWEVYWPHSRQDKSLVFFVLLFFLFLPHSGGSPPLPPSWEFKVYDTMTLQCSGIIVEGVGVEPGITSAWCAKLSFKVVTHKNSIHILPCCLHTGNGSGSGIILKSPENCK